MLPTTIQAKLLLATQQLGIFKTIGTKLQQTSDIGKLTHLFKNAYYQYLKSKILGVAKDSDCCGKICTASPVCRNEIQDLSPQAGASKEPTVQNELKTKLKRVSPEFMQILKDNDDLVVEQNICRILDRLRARSRSRTRRRSRSRSRSWSRSRSRSRNTRRSRRSRHNGNNDIASLIHKLKNSIRRSKSGTQLDKYKHKSGAKQQQDIDATVDAIAAAIVAATATGKTKASDFDVKQNMKCFPKACKRCTCLGLPNQRDSAIFRDNRRIAEQLDALRPRMRALPQKQHRKCDHTRAEATLIEKILQALGPPPISDEGPSPPFLPTSPTSCRNCKNRKPAEKGTADLVAKITERAVHMPLPAPESFVHRGPYLRKGRSALATLVDSMAKEKLGRRNERKGKPRTKCTKRICARPLDTNEPQFGSSKPTKNKNKKRKLIHELWVNPRANELRSSDMLVLEQPSENEGRLRLRREMKMRAKNHRIMQKNVLMSERNVKKDYQLRQKLPARVSQTQQLVSEHRNAIKRHKKQQETPIPTAYKEGMHLPHGWLPNEAESGHITKHKCERIFANTVQQASDEPEEGTEQTENIEMELRNKTHCHTMHGPHSPNASCYVSRYETAFEDAETTSTTPEHLHKDAPDWEAAQYRLRNSGLQNLYYCDEPDYSNRAMKALPRHSRTELYNDQQNNELKDAWQNEAKHDEPNEYNRAMQAAYGNGQHEQPTYLTECPAYQLPAEHTSNNSSEQEYANYFTDKSTETIAQRYDDDMQRMICAADREQQQQEGEQPEGLYHHPRHRPQQQHCEANPRPHYRLGQHEPTQKLAKRRVVFWEK